MTMRSILFRVLAAVLAILASVLIPLSLFKGDSQYPFGFYTLVAGVFLIVPTFLAYAIGGEGAGNRVMVKLMRLLAVPEMLGDKLLRHYVKVPKELTDVDPAKTLNSGSEDTDK